MTTKTWGGKRQGSGSKPKADTRAKPRSVTLDDATVEKAREIGGGNLSQGLRVAVDAYEKQEEPNDQ